jgi:titin
VGTGPASLPSNTLTILLAPPAAPSGLTATASVLSALPPTLSLAWVDHANNETGFTIQRATNPSFTVGLTTISLGPNVTTYVNTTVALHTRYYYRIRAINPSGNSAWSNTVNITTSGQLPADPTNLVFVSTSRFLFFWDQIVISWTDNSSNELGFRIERCPAGANGPWSQIAGVAANRTTYTNIFLPKNTNYWFRVRAYNGDGNSGYTNVLATTSAP